MTDVSQKFLTIRQTARTKVLSEYTLRLMEKQGQLPGVRSGNRFLVNFPMLVEQLDRESLAHVSGQTRAQEG